MIRFLLKRYTYALSIRRSWLLLALIPPLIYWFYSFRIYQDISIAMDAPVALSSSPIDFITAQEVISRADDFLLDKFALRKLYMQIHTGTTREQADRQFRPLLETVKKQMSLSKTPEAENKIRISYYGGNREKGGKLVGYFSDRLRKKAEEGLKRLERLKGVEGLKQVELKRAEFKAALIKDTVVIYQVLYRTERISPALTILIVFFVLIMAWIGVLEWVDPSFKSERQAGRYLGLPTLGSLPNLNKISKTISSV